MNTDTRYNKTLYACFAGYIVQAIVNNFVPLLFLTFQSQYHIPLFRITMLVTMNFGLQLLIDFSSIAFIDKLGYRTCMVLAHVFSASGLILLTILPEICSDPFIGILLSILIYAVGGGLLEVLVSPIVEACPTNNKEKAMSLLHSFYCWGCVAVILFSTVFFYLFGIRNWKILAVLWAIIPILNGICFLHVPIASLTDDGARGLTVKELVGTKLFWLFLLLMLCAGACEQAVSQWASTFAESALGLSKTLGDLVGPMMFAIFMGTSRMLYGKHGEKINLRHFMLGSSLLCLISYLLIAYAPIPVIGLIGCSLCGFSVGILWPGVFSMASASIRNGGTAMFALLALAGDLGCLTGPGLVGMVSSCFGDNLKTGTLAAALFPILLLAGILSQKKK